MAQHALLSASSAKRWMSCTPSARLEEAYPDSTNDYAEEGTLAHEFGEITLKKYIGAISNTEYLARLQKIKNDKLYAPEMNNYVETYASTVVEAYETAKKDCPDAQLIIEGKLDYSQYVEEGFGTGDAIVISDKTIEVLDLKYGQGVRVDAEGNPQLRLYGLGAYLVYGLLYGIEKVKTTIIQPRLDAISSEELTVEELTKWAEEEVSPKAKLAFAGEGKECIGDHCKFCKHKINCKALRTETNKLAKKAFEKVQPSKLTDKALVDLLAKKDVVMDYLKAVGDWALTQVRDEGKTIPGFKLVEGKSRRVYLDEDKVAAKLIANDYTVDDIYELKLLGITAMEKKISKTKFNDLLKDLVVKPQGAPVLAPETDTRKTWEPKINVEDAFKDVKEGETNE